MELERASYIRSVMAILFGSWFEDKQFRKIIILFTQLMSNIGLVCAIVVFRTILIVTLPLSALLSIYMQRWSTISSLRRWNKTFREEYKDGIFDHPYIELRRHIEKNQNVYGKIK